MKQRCVLVTAGGAGIGREIARAFAASGAAVFVCDIDAKALSALAKEESGVETAICDVSSRQDVNRMVGAAVTVFGGLDVLINNAGIAGPTAAVDEINPDDWDKVVQVNLNSAFYVTRLAIPHLKKSASGVIINISSLAGRLGYANRSPYAAAKWGIIGFTKTLAIELGAYGIRANAILPGYVDGPRIQRVFESRAKLSGKSVEEEINAAMAMQSIKHLVDPRDIAALAVFLASDSAKSISGQMLPMDCDAQGLL
jgi:NAD(P)-dependent dehydrogenase (short-subunit alcohol dehydrogenase family)